MLTLSNFTKLTVQEAFLLEKCYKTFCVKFTFLRNLGWFSDTINHRYQDAG